MYYRGHVEGVCTPITKTTSHTHTHSCMHSHARIHTCTCTHTHTQSLSRSITTGAASSDVRAVVRDGVLKATVHVNDDILIVEPAHRFGRDIASSHVAYWATSVNLTSPHRVSCVAFRCLLLCLLFSSHASSSFSSPSSSSSPSPCNCFVVALCWLTATRPCLCLSLSLSVSLYFSP